MDIIEKILQKVAEFEIRHKEIETESATPEFHRSPDAPKKMKEMARIGRLLVPYNKYNSTQAEIDEYKEAQSGDDEDLKELAAEELPRLKEELTATEDELKTLLLTEDESSDKNVIVEIRAGTGGDEAALFAGDLFGMYTHFAESKGWKLDVMEKTGTDLGGFKEVTFSLSGNMVNKVMKFESGGHRVQRVPTTETSGRIHTSACTVAVLAEAEEVDIDIKPDDIRVDVFRASGAGGQHVNKTESAIRITHFESGIVVSCQDGKSQHKNKAQAMKVLRARLYDHYQSKIDSERRDVRKSQIGSGDRSSKIRTYNFPQSRITDHRINFSMYNLEKALLGEIEPLFEALLQFEKEEKLANL